MNIWGDAYLCIQLHNFLRYTLVTMLERNQWHTLLVKMGYEIKWTKVGRKHAS